MAQQQDSKGELRAAFTLRELDKARRSFPMGTTGVFIRVTLAVVFMYLIVVSYLMLGIAGPVFVSILFLAACLTPFFYQSVADSLNKRMAQRADVFSGKESHQEI